MDSDKNLDEFVGLRDYFNDFYARDISKKNPCRAKSKGGRRGTAGIQLRFAKEETDAFYQMAAEKGEKEAEKRYQEMKTEILQKKVRVSEIDTIIQYLYEDRATGRIGTERYETLSAKYETEQKN